MKKIYIGNTSFLSLGVVVWITDGDKDRRYRIIGIDDAEKSITVRLNTFWYRTWITLKSIFYSSLAFPYWIYDADKAMGWVDRKIYGGRIR